MKVATTNESIIHYELTFKYAFIQSSTPMCAPASQCGWGHPTSHSALCVRIKTTYQVSKIIAVGKQELDIVLFVAFQIPC